MDPNNYPSYYPAEANPLPQQPPSKKKPLLLIALIIAAPLCIGGIVAASLLLGANCFNAAAYQELLTIAQQQDSEVQLSDIKQDKPFYTHEVIFDENSDNYSTGTQEDLKRFIQAIGAFYQKNQASAPTLITITTTYPKGQSVDIARQRGTKLQSDLINAGVANRAITIKAPTEVAINDDADPIALITVTPQSKCQER